MQHKLDTSAIGLCSLLYCLAEHETHTMEEHQARLSQLVAVFNEAKTTDKEINTLQVKGTPTLAVDSNVISSCFACEMPRATVEFADWVKED